MKVKEVNYADVRADWGHALFLELTENETRSLIVRGAFDPGALDPARGEREAQRASRLALLHGVTLDP